jgi:transcriptional regulator with XRE-family HTH domain
LPAASHHLTCSGNEWRGLSQSQLAERAGLRQPTIALLDGGKRKGTVQQMRKLAKALNLQLETLVGWDD